MKSLTYKDAGLDLQLYDQAMDRLPSLMKKTHTPRVMDLPGGFAGLFRLGRSKRFQRNFRDPVLVSGTDGVGTKLKIASRAGVYNTVGIDLVAMCVNDCLCLGAEPLFFLDYLALPKDDPNLIEKLVAGVCEGCADAGCALLGGETAILPDVYSPGEFDLAGFCVAVAERKRLINGSQIREGDVVLGLASSGFHSNGYSLVRKAVFDAAKLDVATQVAELGTTVGEALLRPTRIYVRPVLSLLKHFGKRAAIRGIAHITGGGLADNLERILPNVCRVVIDRATWQPPPIFSWLQGLGRIDRDEMFRVFNMGIGLVLVVKPKAVDEVQRRLAKHDVDSFVIAEVEAGGRGVVYAN